MTTPAKRGPGRPRKEATVTAPAKTAAQPETPKASVEAKPEALAVEPSAKAPQAMDMAEVTKVLDEYRERLEKLEKFAF
jgi:hypothetical protein